MTSPAPASALSAGGLKLRTRLAATTSAHEHRAAAGLIALLVLVYLWPVLLAGHVLLPVAGLYFDAPFASVAPPDLVHYINRTLEDVTGTYYPWDVLARRLLHAGAFPAWNPTALAGTPLFANYQLAWLSPFTLPLWVLPLRWALGFAAALKLWVAGFGTYLLVRELRLGLWPALLAGVSFALCAFDVVWLSHGVQVSVAVLLPWTLWLVERIVRHGRSADALAAGVVVAVAMLGGHPGTQLHLLTAAMLYALMRAAALRDVEARERVRRMGLLGAAVALGVLTSAVVLLPAQMAAHGSAGELARKQGSVEFVGTRMSAGILRTLLFPDWWGRPSDFVKRGPATYNERTLYTGTIALLLAFVGMTTRGRWRVKAPFAALAAIGASVAIRAPGIHGLVQGLPLFDRVQNQRMVLWTELGIAVLAAFGLHAALERPRRWQTWAAPALAVLAAAVALATLTLQPGDVGGALHRLLHREGAASAGTLALASIGWWLIPAAALGIAFAVLWLRPHAATVVTGAVVLLGALDMLHFAHGYQPMPPAARVPPPATPAIAFLQRHVSEGRMAAAGDLVLGDMPSVYGLRAANGYEQPQPSVRFFELWRSGQTSQSPGSAFVVQRPTMRMLGVLGLRYVLTAPDARPERESRLQLAYRGPDAAVFRNPFAMPRALVARAVVVTRWPGQDVSTVAEGAFDPRAEAVVRGDELGAQPSPVGGAGAVRVVAEQNARVTLHASLERPSLVILDDAWAPGWSVTIDGRRARAVPADVVLRSVVVPAGQHDIVWSYRVPGLRVGALLSGLALVGFAAWGGWLVRRGRRVPSRPA